MSDSPSPPCRILTPATRYRWRNRSSSMLITTPASLGPRSRPTAISSGPGQRLTRTDTFNCADNYGGPGYRPEMFPVKDFYYKRLGGAPFSFGWDFGYFDSGLFCDNINDSAHACGFFSPGRRAICGTLTETWMNNRPPLSANLGITRRSSRLTTAHYLSARNGGGSDINAERRAQAERNVQHGRRQRRRSDDRRHRLAAGRGGNYVSAHNGGGSTSSRLTSRRLRGSVSPSKRLGAQGRSFPATRSPSARGTATTSAR